MKGERGFALVITLIVTALLVALAAEFVNEVYVETSLSHNFVDGQQASLLAASGVDGGVALLRFTTASQGYTTLADSWAKPLKMEDERGGLTVIIEEESAKLNLNTVAGDNGTFLPPFSDVFLRLLKKQGISSDVADALADWIDTNDEPHPGGAETSYYSSLRPPYKVKNGFLDTVEELCLVKGVTRDVLANKLQPYVTVYSDSGLAAAVTKININTVPRQLLLALHEDMTDSLAKEIEDYRKQTPFQNIGDLSKVSGMRTQMVSALSGVCTCTGKVFRIRSEARVRETTRLVEAVVRMSGTRAMVIYWREYTP
ncbi:MAG TPA: type II secretion system minor pseudopilin GspK [Geobacteraceae bacterium]